MIDELKDRQAIYWLDSILFGRKEKHILLNIAGRGKDILNLPDSLVKEILNPKDFQSWIKNRYINIEDRWLDLQKSNVSMTYYGARDYPKKLLEIPDPPFVLYYRGTLPDEDVPSVAMIGARQNSEYGAAMARQFARYFAQNGIIVISGMAMGIDGISQKEALEYGGKSYGVLGCGVDVIYPNSNKNLYSRLEQEGGVISEYLPGTMPQPMLFPQRNRIISGLADSVLVIEAREKSGTLITVDMALEQGREVFAVPGRCTDMLSHGCNQLIRNGATCVCNPQDLANDMRWEHDCLDVKKKKKLINLSTGAQQIFKALDFQPKSQDDILQSLKMQGIYLSASELCQGLLELEMKGVILRNFGQYSVTVNEF